VVDANGWMHTGNVATIDDEGWAAICGRLKDVVIRGGENLFPAEVENYLLQHPAVADVQVFGVPDPVFGEHLCAWVRVRYAWRLRLRRLCCDVHVHVHW
jgi:fatty-acyl-CoA synthase